MSSKITIEEHEVCSVELDTGPSNGISRNKCVVCKGRSMCGISPCPVLSSIELKFEDGVISRDIISGKSNGLNIGWERYPNDTIYASVLSNDYSPAVLESDVRRIEDGREHVFYRLSNIFSPYV
ncbi:MAG TPA: hypothetical protein PLC12_06475, partial [Candidatus Methanofastidiosa archaeon]|nr:hypothetical protein [Candidatus Methanofastidiosa archaeon]